MAYKFQLGPATLSGSLTQEGAVTAKDAALSGSSLTLPSSGLSLNGTAVSATAAELNKLDGFTGTTTHLNRIDGAAPGVITNNVVVVYDGSGRVKSQGFLIDNTLVINSSGDVDANSLSVGGTAITSPPGDLNKLSGSSADVTAAKLSTLSALTDAEIGFIDGVTAGTAAASKALVLDGSSNISGVGTIGATSLSASAGISGSHVVLIDASSIAGTGLEDNGSGALQTDFDALTALGGTGLHQTQDSFPFSDNGVDKRITFSNLEDAIFANVTGDATIAAGGALTIANGAVDSDMLAGSIANSKLANDSITVGTTEIDLGASSTTLAGMTGIDFAAGNASIAANIGANTLTLGGNTSTVSIAGNLTVAGTTTTVNSTTVEVADKNIVLASGGGDDTAANGGGITVSSSAGDKTFIYSANNESFQSNQHLDVASGKAYLINGTSSLTADGAAKVQSAVAGEGLAHSAGVLSLDFNEVTEAAVAVANDSILFLDSDGNASRRDTIADFVTAMAGGGLSATNGVLSTSTNAVALIDNLGTGSTGINYWADLSGNESMVLPSSPSVGDSIRIKAPSNCGDAGNITISPLNGSHTIDGAASITLESPHAAVELVYVVSNLWKVF